MHIFALVLTCLACMSDGGRVRMAGGRARKELWNHKLLTNAFNALSSSNDLSSFNVVSDKSERRALKKLLLEVSAAAAWQCPSPAFAVGNLCIRSRLGGRHRVVSMQIKDQEKARASASTLEQQPEEVALRYFEALSDTWDTGTMRLAGTMRADVSVATPVWNCANLAEYEQELMEAQQFFSNLSAPALKVVSKRALDDGRVAVEWMLGIEWPAIWRPRVNILGESTLTILAASNGDLRITRVDETWHQSPLQVFLSQVLPKFRDVASFWNSPTAEYLPMPIVSSRNGYDVVRIPPMLALQVEWTETGDLIAQDQSPVPPTLAFPGAIKRSEWYNCISPAMLEKSLVTVDLPGNETRVGQRRRWICPLPTRFGADPSDFPEPDARKSNADDPNSILPSDVVPSSASVRYLHRPAQMFAVSKLKSIPSFELVLSTVTDLAKKVEADGYKVVKRNDRPVVMQLSSDIKYGFNSEKQLARLVWLSVPDFFREEYAGIVIDEGQPLPGDDAG